MPLTIDLPKKRVSWSVAWSDGGKVTASVTTTSLRGQARVRYTLNEGDASTMDRLGTPLLDEADPLLLEAWIKRAARRTSGIVTGKMRGAWLIEPDQP